MQLPEIKKHNNIDTLFVHGKPFIALSGEVHNSSSSSLDYMESHVWPNLESLNMNSVIVPIYWELIEPKEGKFEFALLDGIIAQARKYGKKLILIWFGLWKNSESMYVPAWMKKDFSQYFNVKKANGEVIPTISPFCSNAIEKDANALAKVMAFIKKVDEKENTVITIQVENEIGLLGTDRDYSAKANEAFSLDVPTLVQEAFDVKGSWREAFGDDAEEYFMCHYFAKAVEKITCEAQAIYNLPCYANAWLRQFPWYPGSYPIGGPVASMGKMWKLVAPSLFCLAPDIYVSYVAQVMDEYAFEGNPLFIPEVRKDAITASYALYAFGKHNAICYSPFGIEDLVIKEEEIEKPSIEAMMALNIDPTAFETDGSKEYLSNVYGLFRNMQGTYFNFRGTEQLQCYLKKSEADYGTFLKFRKYNISVSYAQKQSYKPLAAGMIIELDVNTFYIIGMMSKIRFMPKTGVSGKVEILSLKEGYFCDDKWIEGRVLNGDEKMTMALKDRLRCLKVEVFVLE